MKITAAILLIFSLHVTAKGVSQTITISGKNIPLKTVFNEIRKQSGYMVFYNDNLLDDSKKITVEANDQPLLQFLDQTLHSQQLDYVIENKTIVLKRKEPSQPGADLTSPPIDVKGRVLNEKSEPLSNANVIIKRLGKGTITDAKGEFSLRNVQPSDILIISFIGYASEQIVVQNDREDYAVILKPSNNELDKVIKQAYGTTSKRLSTGNIGVIRADDIEKQPVMNPMIALQGQVPGVLVTNSSGYASGTIKIQIRGRNTINDFPSDPLYIIDGVPITILDLYGQDSYGGGQQGAIQSGILSPAGGQSPFFSLNPADIESMEVLKDADATAIYGSRGSNGVILITTKKGRPDKPRLDISVYQGISKTPRYYHLLNTQEYIGMRKEALQNDGLSMDINNAPDLVAWDTSRYTNWQKYCWGGTGKETDVQASISGGDNRTAFRIASAFHRRTEILSTAGSNKRGSLSLNFNHKSLDQKFSIGLTAAYSLTSSDLVYVPGAINISPNAPAIFDDYGNLNYRGWAPLDGAFQFASLLQPYTSKSNFLNSNILIGYEIIKGLSVKLSVGYNNLQSTQTYMMPKASTNPAYNLTGSSYLGNTFVHNLILEPQIEYSRYIGKGKISILYGYSKQSNKTTSTQLSGFGYKDDDLLTSIGSAPTRFVSNASAEYEYKAAFGRITYNWENKYVINLNGRRDGSSKFGPGRQFGNFGSIGGAWIFSEEKFFKLKLPVVSFGKIRASYGTVGGDQISNYQYLSQWTFGQGSYNNVNPIAPQGHVDSLLHWQVNKKLEIAMELGFAKDRITFEAAWYKNRCNNQLIQFPTPLFTGFSQVTSNSIANVQNSGIELSLNARILESKTFNWDFKVNIGKNRSKLLAFPNLSQSPYKNLYVIGKSLNITRKLHWIGVDQLTGLYIFEDKNKDGQVSIDYSGNTVDDRIPYELDPKFDGGFTNTLTYKNFSFSVFWYFKKQTGRNALASLTFPGNNYNQPTTALARWQKSGDKTNVARFTNNGFSDISYINFQYNSDAVYSDASFLRLQNANLSYNLPQKIIAKLRIQNAKIYLQGQNLILITNYNGLDPEIQSFLTLPMPRTVTVGLSCNF